MLLVRATTALLFTLLATGPAAAQETSRPATVLGTKEERAATAAEHYAQNRPVEASLGFEGLFKDYPAQIDFLFNAAASRFGAGHFAHAVAYTRQYLAAPAVGADDRKEAEAQLREALAQTTAVTVTATAEGGGAVTLIARHVPRDSSDVRPELSYPATSGSASELQLDPGVWLVRGQADGHTAAEQQIEVRKGKAATVTLQLPVAPADAQPDPTPDGDAPRAAPRDVPPIVVWRHKLGFGITGGIIAAAGLGVTIAGSIRARLAGDCTDPTFDSCVDALATGLTVRGFGTLTLGAGLGLAAGGLTWVSKSADTRKKVWIAESVLGGVSAIAGVALTVLADRSFTAANDAGKISDWSAYHAAHGTLPLHAVGGALVGFGGGALVSSVTGLVTQRKHRRNLGVNAMMGRGQAGLVLTGRF